MTSTARRAKKSLREDQLVTTTFRLTEWAQEHFNQVIIGIVALVAVVAVLVFAANSRENSAREAQRQLGVGLTQLQSEQFSVAKATFQQIAEQHGGAPGASARFFQAECELREGNYAAAVDAYDRYLGASSAYPLFEASALVGKAMAQEGLRDYLSAANTLVQALAKMDARDPRYASTAFQAGEFFVEAKNESEALKYFEMVAKDGTGDLQARANVMVSMLK